MGFATGTTTFYKTKAAREKKKMQQPHHSQISDGIKKEDYTFRPSGTIFMVSPSEG
jgi:hypothetical protein